MTSYKKLLKSSGQTLIETMAALFILTMGISAAVGLAVYAFSSSSTILKEIVATGLAREGMEAVRNMRDTNWLNDTLGTPANGNSCTDFNDSGQNDCYPHWLGTGSSMPPFFCIDPSNNANICDGLIATGTPQNFSLGLNAGNSIRALWKLSPQPNNNGNYGMTYDANNFNVNNKGFYYSDGSTPCSNVSGIADYCRKIIITRLAPIGTPYTQANFPLLEVQSQVWWVDKKCPRSLDWPGPGSCSLELDTYLTNWKNY